MDEKKPTCKYGSKCYRKNKEHLDAYCHSDHNEESPPKKKGKIDAYFGRDEKPATCTAVENTATAEVKMADVMKRSGQTSGYKRCEEDQALTSGNLEGEAPPSPQDVKDNIKSKFLVHMPEDFYEFWEFAKSVNPKNPKDAFLSSCGLELVGPFDVLAGTHKKVEGEKSKKPCYLRHWRYYYDPPEMLTVVRGEDNTQFHMGYFRDDPKDMPAFVASNAAKASCTITPRGENLFAAFSWFIDDKTRKDKSQKAALSKVKDKLCDWAKDHGYSLEPRTAAMKARDSKSCCKTFHGAGMVVPIDENEVGYREVPETTGDLKKMFKRIADSKSPEDRDKNFDPLMEIIMLVQFANDECDYGEGLELGLDLFSYGGEAFHKTILNLLPLAYQLLGRHEYAEICRAHLEDRRHSATLSQLD